MTDWREDPAAAMWQEREQMCLQALRNAAALGLSQDDLRTLCFECGIRMKDVQPLPAAA